MKKNRRTHLTSSYNQQTKQHGVEQKYPPRTFARASYSTRYCPFSGVWNFHFGHQWLYSLTYHLLSKTQNNKDYYPCQFSGVKFSRRSHWDPAPRCLQSNLLWPICVTSSTFFTRTSISTVLHITVMTCDRFIYIRWALRYDDIVQHGRVFVGLCVTWFISPTSLVRLHWTLNVNIITSKVDLARVQEKETIYSRHVTSLCSFSFL